MKKHNEIPLEISDILQFVVHEDGEFKIESGIILTEDAICNHISACVHEIRNDDKKPKWSKFVSQYEILALSRKNKQGDYHELWADPDMKILRQIK